MSSQPSPSPTPLIILGMHRSGTSLTAGLLQQAGLQIGQELIAANPANPKGHFENVAFYRFHQAVLRSQGVSEEGWTLQQDIPVEAPYRTEALDLITSQAAAPAWGWKDPRTVLFVDFWADLLPDARFLIIYRAPWEVIDSLYRRSDKLFTQQPDLAIKIWMHYNQKLIDFYQQFPKRCVLVNITTLTAAFPKLLRVLNKRFQLTLTEPVESTLYDAALLDQAVSNSYQPSQVAHYFPKATKLYENLETAAWFPKGMQPDLRWQKQTAAKFHRLAAFENWQRLRNGEQYNQLLTRQLEQAVNQEYALQDQLQTTTADLQFSNSVVEEVRQQLQQANVEREQFRTLVQQRELALAETEQRFQQAEMKQQEKETALLAVEQQLLQAQTELQEKAAALIEIEQRLLQTQTTLREKDAALLATELETTQCYHQLQATLQAKETALIVAEQKLQQTAVALQEKEAGLLVTEDHLRQTQTELSIVQLQLEETQQTLQQQNGRLEQCQTDLTVVRHDAEQMQIALTETCNHLSALEAERQQLLAELEHTRSHVEQMQTDHQQTQTELQQTQILLRDTTEMLQQSQMRLQQITEALQSSETRQQALEALVTQFQLQQQQNQTEQTTLKSRLQQATVTIGQLKTEVEQVQTHFQKTQSQLHRAEVAATQWQIQGEAVQRTLEQTQQALVQSRWQTARLQFQSTLSPTLSQSELQYQRLVWDAWYAYGQGDCRAMIEALQHSTQYTTMSRSELVLQWVQQFTQWSQNQNEDLDVNSLIHSREWQLLVNQLCTQKRRIHT